MKLCFLPFVREGIAPTATVAARGQVPIVLRLESPGRQARDVSRVMPMLGPGDVMTIEPRQVLRVTPSRGTRDAEPEFFPAIEFDAPDLPWAYSPTIGDSRRVPPWIVLVVVEALEGVSVVPGQQGQSPWVLRLPAATAMRELPDLTESWGWAHAQVACASTGEIAATLANHPDRTLSRLLSPRRLLPFRAYHACVVPAFLSGRIAGLGGNPAGHPSLVTGREPAWSPNDLPGELPVYYTWTFRTGEAGDFESLAQRLRAAPLDATLAPTPLRLSLLQGDGDMAVDWEAPLRVRGQEVSRPPRPPAAVEQIKDALEPGGTRRVLGPAFFGAPWLEARTLEPIESWAAELNLTPALRAAAGLGAEAVRGEQETLVEAASEQLDEFRARQREGRRLQLATAFVNRVKVRLAAAPAPESARVFAPLAVTAQVNASDVGIYTAAGRRLVRKTWTSGSIARPPVAPVSPAPPAAPATPAVPSTPTPVRPSPATPITPATPVIPARLARFTLPSLPRVGDLPVAELAPAVIFPAVVIREPVKQPPPPIAPVDTTAIPTGAFAPKISRPMSEPLAERFPELMLPGSGTLAQDGVLLVESNPAFVEAYLTGANQELSYELLWRGLPADSRATAFRRFWPYTSETDDIDDIRTWGESTRIGTHVKTGASMVLLVRSELVRRYPSALVAAVPAVWNRDGSRSPMKDAAQMVLPSFRGRVGEDILYAGFSRPPREEVIGARTSDGPAGWFFLLSENPGDPRFGLDPFHASPTPTRSTLAWNHLSLPADAQYATPRALPSMTEFAAGNADAASIANLVRQRPFRAYLHASLLIRLPA